MPIYNVEEYIEECLECLLNQSIIKDLEVIMIDDGSTDDSRYIIEKYALDYENFYTYHKKNEGTGIARNYGIELAKGDYIAFLDPDDYINEDYYEKLYALAKRDSYDFVMGTALRFDRYKIWEEILYFNTFNNVEGNIYSTNIKKMHQLVWDTCVWNKLIKRSFIDKYKIRFPNENIAYQDLVFSIKLHCFSKFIAISKEIIYFWRYRKSNTSRTQQIKNIKNFNNRIFVINLILNFLIENNIDNEILEAQYFKWLHHDLKMFIKRIKYYDSNYQANCVNEINNIIKLIPNEIKDNLNSYRRIIFKMVENNDIHGLLSFAHLEEQLQKNPKIFNEILDEKYKKYITLQKDFEKENLKAEIEHISSNDKEVLIIFKEHIPYIPKEDNYKLVTNLIDEDNCEYSIECRNIGININQICIPLNLIIDKNHLKIKVNHASKTFIKETYLENNKRRIINYKKYEINFSKGVNKLLYIDIREKNENTIMISNIIYEDGHFMITGVSKSKIKNLTIKNLMTFNKVNYSISFNEDVFNNSNVFNNDNLRFNEKKINDIFFTVIPLNDLINVVSKWELGCEELFNEIKLCDNYKFFIDNYEIKFKNMRNKILIEVDLFNRPDKIIELNNSLIKSCIENRELKTSNKHLKIENKKLNDIISKYKSRKIVRLIDKIKN